MNTTKPLTAKQVRQLFRARGVSFASWARDNGFRPTHVMAVVNGRFKGHYGTAHDIAVKLGMKAPPPEHPGQHQAAA